jgi:hypothetical protein
MQIKPAMPIYGEGLQKQKKTSLRIVQTTVAMATVEWNGGPLALLEP